MSVQNATDQAPVYSPLEGLSETSAIGKKLDCMRYTSSAFMLAMLVVSLATVVLIGLAQARYITPDIPLYMFCTTAPLLLITIAIDCCLRSTARANNIDPDDYFRTRQHVNTKSDKDSKKNR